MAPNTFAECNLPAAIIVYAVICFFFNYFLINVVSY